MEQEGPNGTEGRKVGGGRHGISAIGGRDGQTIFHGWRMDGVARRSGTTGSRAKL